MMVMLMIVMVMATSTLFSMFMMVVAVFVPFVTQELFQSGAAMMPCAANQKPVESHLQRQRGYHRGQHGQSNFTGRQ